MADVVQKAITANDIKQGSATVFVNKQGGSKILPPDKNKAPTLAEVEADLTNRFDNPKYYG